jgi:hypothetical protein
MLAGFVQSTLDAIDDTDRALGREVRRHLKYETLRTIESASPIALVSVDLDVELTECFFAVAGPERAQSAFRETLRQGFDKRMLRPVLNSARVVFGSSLVEVLRWAPRVWNLIYRDAGEMVVRSRDAGFLCLEIRDLPLAISASRHYLAGSAATFAGFLDVAGVEGQVSLEGPDLSSRSAAFVLRWSPYPADATLRVPRAA